MVRGRQSTIRYDHSLRRFAGHSATEIEEELTIVNGEDEGVLGGTLSVGKAVVPRFTTFMGFVHPHAVHKVSIDLERV